MSKRTLGQYLKTANRKIELSVLIV